LADAVQTAFFEGKGICHLQELNSDKSIRILIISVRWNYILEPNVHLFSFNNPYGACPVCEGYGNIIEIDAELVVPNTTIRF
jgi:excinuclease ABC subunit A